MKKAQSKTIHHGQHIKRLRELMGIRQETIAADLHIT